MLEKFYRISSASGVSITIDTKGAIDINLCNLTLQNNRIDFEKKVTGIKEVNELSKYLTVKSIVALNLSGKGILIRQTEKIEDINSNTFNKILPNANIEEFYIQNFISGNRSFVAIVRKADADKWIHLLNELGFVVLSLTLGPFSIENIISQLNVYDDEFAFNGHIISRTTNGEWTDYRFDSSSVTSFPLKVELEQIDEKLITAYSSAFQLLLASKIDAIQAAVPSLNTLKDQIIGDRKFKIKGGIILIGFFVLLLVNFILFSWLNNTNTILMRTLSRSARSTTDLEKISEQMKQKESMLHHLGWEDGINKSILIDQIAALLPPDLTWKEVSVDPVDLITSRLEKSLIFYDHRIRITGTSERIIPVNEWIARLKITPWVKNIQLDSYTFNSELNTGQFIVTVNY